MIPRRDIKSADSILWGHQYNKLTTSTDAYFKPCQLFFSQVKGISLFNNEFRIHVIIINAYYFKFYSILLNHMVFTLLSFILLLIA